MNRLPENNEPNSNDLSRTDAEVLLQRYFDGRITESEADDLLRHWDADPTFDLFARKNYDVEYTLRFLKHSKSFLAAKRKELAAERLAARKADPLAVPFVASDDWLADLVRLSGYDPTPRPLIHYDDEADSPPRPSLLSFLTLAHIDRSLRYAVLGTVATLLVGTVLLLGYHLFSYGGRSGAAPTVAHLVGFDHVVWGNCLAPILPGDPIEKGWLRIESGSAALKLLNGSEIVLEGPAEFRIDSDTNVFLQNGYLSADVPSLSKKLKIGTPQLDIDVLGTAFWVKADPDNSEVHLLRGKLELAGSSFGKLLLGAGEAFALPKWGKSRRFEVVREDFTPSKKIADKTEATIQAWDADERGGESNEERALEQTVEQDASLLVHFDFERIGRTVPNVAPVGRKTIPAGKLTGCARTEGHGPRSRGIAFRRLNDRVGLDVPGRFSSLTLCGWVKIAKPVESRISIFVSSGMPPGSLQWMLGHGGVILANVTKTDSTPTLIAKAKPVFTESRIGCWVHLATVIDAEAGRVVFYVDGEEWETLPLDFTPIIEIGAATLGRWGSVSSRDVFDGELSIDDFLLFDRPLTAEEIRPFALKH